MQQLHLVGFTTDLDSLIFSSRKGAKSGSFVLPLDERLLVLIAEAVRRRKLEGDEIEVPLELRSPSSVVRRQSALSPREIQDRLRAGRSIEEVASEAGVAEEWVGRFSAPVEAERSQIVRRARQLVYAKPRRGDSGDAMGASVRWNLADRGVRLTNDEFDDGWSAYQLADHTWMVTFTFVSRKREQQAEWEVDLAEGDVLARNRLASDLAYLEPGRRRRSAASLQPGRPPTARSSSSSSGRDRAEPAPPPPPELPVLAGVTGIRSSSSSSVKKKKPAAAKKAAPARGSAKRAPAAGGARTASARSTAKRTTARRPATKRATPNRPAAKRTTTGRAAASRPAAKRTTAGRATPSRPAAKRTTAGRASASRPAAKRTTAGRAATKRPAASKSAAKRGRGGSGRGLPPATTAPVATAPEPNELSRRRLQLVSGGQPSTPRRTGMSGRAGYGGGARPVYPGRRSAAGTSMAAPAAAARRPAEPRPPDRQLDVVPEPDQAAAAEARRAERRRARAEARKAEAGNNGDANSRILTSEPPPRPDVPEPEDDGRVVTIRANRATPPRTDGAGDGSGEVILPANRPPLRPAQPAAQPRRSRRFGRTTR